MVVLPSLPNMRLSEFVVSLWPTTSGLFVVPWMYSAALRQPSANEHQQHTGKHIHIVIESERRAVKRLRHVADPVWKRHNLRESAILHTTKGVATCDESDHLSLIEALTSKRGRMAVEALLGLGDTGDTGLGSVYASTAEGEMGTAAICALR